MKRTYNNDEVLLDKELIYKSEDICRIYDVFLNRYLQNTQNIE